MRFRLPAAPRLAPFVALLIPLRPLHAQAADDSSLAASRRTPGHAPTRGTAPPHDPPPHNPLQRDAPHLSAQAVALGTHAAPAYGGAARTETSLAQPVVMAQAPLAGGRVRLTATLDLEGLTLRGGQLNPGIYGEGFVDRRHPHTVAHELVASAEGGRGGVRASLSAGKGFVAFGTDDPMVRPFVLFPVNHHLAQILERYVAVAGVRAGRPHLGDALLEATTFDGDEPQSPWRWPRLARFGDSWALRATLRPAFAGRSDPAAGDAHGAHAGHAADPSPRSRLPLELSASIARVPSPENPLGAGLDQHKASVAARWASGAPLGAAGLGIPGRGAYALVEWARTDERRGARRAFRYESVLFEGALRHHGVEVGARWERTTRPEEERLVDPFRTVRPHNEFNVLGLTEWRTATTTVGVPVRAGALRLLPFAEVARAVPREVLRPSAFEPRAFYGAAAVWTTVLGLRLGVGTPHARMGRYGVAAAH